MIIFGKKERSIDKIDMRDTMYPSYGLMIADSIHDECIPYSTWYGYSYGKSSIMVGDSIYHLNAGDFFCIPVKSEIVKFDAIYSRLFAVARLGFKGQHVVGKTEKSGRLSYIDGCSDSLIVYPPRLGDASLSYLHFPCNINQSFHTHPSIRIGCVIDGSGSADCEARTKSSSKLDEGVFFCLTEQELHRFRTDVTSMDIIAYHPDGDWGPTDENHTMFNRTYIKK